jgi:predicted ATPase
VTISLRAAALSDNWRRLRNRPFETRLISLEHLNLGCLQDGEIALSGGITVIIGANGVGKSTILSAMSELLTSTSEIPGLQHGVRLTGSQNTGKMLVGAVEHEVTCSDGADGNRSRIGNVLEGEIGWFDSSLITLIPQAIHEDSDFQDLLQGIEPAPLSPDELEIARYLVKKEYTAIDIYEVTDYNEWAIFPYFRVTVGAMQYGSERMGEGELGLLLILSILRHLPPNSIFVLEEPETHVSIKSQVALMDVLAKYSVERGIYVIVATHSSSLVKKVPTEDVKLVVQEGGRSFVVPEPTRAQIEEILGEGVMPHVAVLVEDEAAKEFAANLMSLFAPGRIYEFEFINAGSSSHITQALKNMPVTGRWFKMIGLYDGDKREDASISNGSSWPAKFLPGNEPSEKLYRKILQSTENHEVLAQKIGSSATQLRMALSAMSGSDNHDWDRGIAEFLGISIVVLRKALCQLYLQDDAAQAEAKEFIRDFLT